MSLRTGRTTAMSSGWVLRRGAAGGMYGEEADVWKAGHTLGTLHLSRQEPLFRAICRLLTLQGYARACGRNPGSQDTGPAAKRGRLHGKHEELTAAFSGACGAWKEVKSKRHSPLLRDSGKPTWGFSPAVLKLEAPPVSVFAKPPELLR